MMKEYDASTALRWREPRRQKPRHLHAARTEYAQKVEALADDLAQEGVIETRSVAKSVRDAEERAAIEAFLDKLAPRKYAPADSGDDFNLCNWLRSKGYEVQRKCTNGQPWLAPRAPFFVNGKAFSRKSFLAFVNKVRAQFELQPLGRPA